MSRPNTQAENPYSAGDFILRLERSQRHATRPPRWYKGRPMALCPSRSILEGIVWIVCLWIPRIYKGYFQWLRITTSAKGKDVYAPENRAGAADAWQEYCRSLVDEWNSMNIIGAILLTAAISFLLGEINRITYYALIYCIISALASISNAAYYYRRFRGRLMEKRFNILQLDHYLCHYCTVDNLLISAPLVMFVHSLVAFLIAVLAHLWPHTTEVTKELDQKLGIASRVIFLAFVFGHFILLVGSAISCQSLFLNPYWILDQERQEIQLHIDSIRKPTAAMSDREALYTKMPIFQMKNNGSNWELEREAPRGVGGAKAGGSAHVPTGWNRKFVQLPSDAIPLGFEGVPEQLEQGVENVIGQLYVGKVEIKDICHFVAVSLTHGDRMINDNQNSPNQRYLGTWCSVLCGSMSDFGWLKITLENSPFRSSSYQRALNANGYKLLSLCRPGCACVRSPIYAACLNPKLGGTPTLGCVREGWNDGLFVTKDQVTKEREFYVLLVKQAVRIRANSL